MPLDGALGSSAIHVSQPLLQLQQVLCSEEQSLYVAGDEWDVRSIARHVGHCHGQGEAAGEVVESQCSMAMMLQVGVHRMALREGGLPCTALLHRNIPGEKVRRRPCLAGHGLGHVDMLAMAIVGVHAVRVRGRPLMHTTGVVHHAAPLDFLQSLLDEEVLVQPVWGRRGRRWLLLLWGRRLLWWRWGTRGLAGLRVRHSQRWWRRQLRAVRSHHAGRGRRGSCRLEVAVRVRVVHNVRDGVLGGRRRGRRCSWRCRRRGGLGRPCD